MSDLLRRAREELYQAKVLVRATRNHTKVTAAALADSEARIDDLIAEVERELALLPPTRIPTPTEAQEHDHTSTRQARTPTPV